MPPSPSSVSGLLGGSLRLTSAALAATWHRQSALSLLGLLSMLVLTGLGCCYCLWPSLLRRPIQTELVRPSGLAPAWQRPVRHSVPRTLPPARPAFNPPKPTASPSKPKDTDMLDDDFDTFLDMDELDEYIHADGEEEDIALVEEGTFLYLV